MNIKKILLVLTITGLAVPFVAMGSQPSVIRPYTGPIRPNGDPKAWATIPVWHRPDAKLYADVYKDGFFTRVWAGAARLATYVRANPVKSVLYVAGAVALGKGAQKLYQWYTNPTVEQSEDDADLVVTVHPKTTRPGVKPQQPSSSKAKKTKTASKPRGSKQQPQPTLPKPQPDKTAPKVEPKPKTAPTAPVAKTKQQPQKPQVHPKPKQPACPVVRKPVVRKPIAPKPHVQPSTRSGRYTQTQIQIFGRRLEAMQRNINNGCYRHRCFDAQQQRYKDVQHKFSWDQQELIRFKQGTLQPSQHMYKCVMHKDSL